MKALATKVRYVFKEMATIFILVGYIHASEHHFTLHKYVQLFVDEIKSLRSQWAVFFTFPFSALTIPFIVEPSGLYGSGGTASHTES